MESKPEYLIDVFLYQLVEIQSSVEKDTSIIYIAFALSYCHYRQISTAGQPEARTNYRQLTFALYPKESPGIIWAEVILMEN